MKDVFVDTAYWVAILVNQDDHHSRAVAWSHVIEPPLFTTDSVVFEVGNSLASIRTRRHAAAWLRSVIQEPRVTIVSADLARLRKAVDLYGSRRDKDWGLTDCHSFNVMREYGLALALTSDRHFVQAGFRALLLEEPPVS